MQLEKGILCFVVWSLPFLLLAQNDTLHTVNWAKGLTWEQVKEKAKQENKYVFVDLFATWCVPCKKMDKEVYSDNSVVQILNRQFVSVKLQMDQTPKDNGLIKNGYSLAKQFNQQYVIDGYPSYLFFNPEGRLAYKAIGFRDVSGFLMLAKEALADPEERYKKAMQKYKSGILEYEMMPDLALEASSKKEKQTSIEIAKKFKEEYLDKLTDEQAFQKKSLRLIASFCFVLINTKDRYFKLFYLHPELADSIMGDFLSARVVLGMIQKEEIRDNVYNNGKPITYPRPRWKRYRSSIKEKYGEKYVNKIFPNDQISFYQTARDWKNYVKYVNVKIKKVPPQANGHKFEILSLGAAWTLNHYAWQVFLYCNDKNTFKKAIPWVDMAVKFDTTKYNFNYYDTKANLLYKMGKIKDAIDLEEFALARSNSDEGIVNNLKNMKAGLPTWFIPSEKKK